MSRVAIMVGPVTTQSRLEDNPNELATLLARKLVLEEYEIGVVVKALSEARQRSAMPHEARVIDRFADALQQGAR